MRLIVTRPAAQAQAWVAGLKELGVDAQALPLIDIGPADDLAAVRAAWSSLAQRALVMFVSANAVAHFFAAAPAGMGWPAGLRAGATGPGTVAALRDAGLADAAIVAPAADAPQFDSEALWQRLAPEPWAGRSVLVVRGEAGRDWLAEHLRERGAEIDFVAAYRRRSPVLQPDEVELLQRAQTEPAAHLWLFSSSEALGHLAALAPQADWSRSQALATHPRIAAVALAAGFATAGLVPPDMAAVAHAARTGPSIESGAL